MRKMARMKGKKFSESRVRRYAGPKFTESKIDREAGRLFVDVSGHFHEVSL